MFPGELVVPAAWTGNALEQPGNLGIRWDTCVTCVSVSAANVTHDTSRPESSVVSPTNSRELHKISTRAPWIVERRGYGLWGNKGA